ncbi:MAG: SGNH/GDSL hydrolase family protein, partial [Planctomycetota bacterium]
EPFDRLPKHAQGLVRDEVWNLSRSSTGMCVGFRSNAYQIHVRWTLHNEQIDEPNFNRCAFGGVDLYGDDEGTWRWVACTNNFDGTSPQVCLAQALDGRSRDYRLYLPLRNQLAKLEIGVPTLSDLEAIPPRQDRPIVVYGTSIVHGAYASRSGMAWTSILGRRVNRPMINLGVSGNARMEIEIADLLAELEAEIYILDPLPNMDLDLVNERAEAFLRRLRERRPTTPIVLIEDFPRVGAWIRPADAEAVNNKCQRYREIVETLQGEGMAGLHYIEGHDLLGTDNEASIDGIHPGDVGFMRMMKKIEPVVTALL